MKFIFKLPSHTNQRYIRVPSDILKIGLSSDALYLYVWILDKPEDWAISEPKKLATQVDIMGRDRCYKALAELESALLFVRGKIRDESGKITSYYRRLHALPFTENTETGKLVPEKPEAAEPLPENPEAVNKNKQTKTITYDKDVLVPEYPYTGSLVPEELFPENPEPYKEQTKQLTNKKNIQKKDHQIALDEFNDLAGRIGLPKVKILNTTRLRNLQSRLKDHGLDGWREALQAIEKSSFLCGDKTSWKLTFDFLVGSSNFLKVIEGQYGHDRQVRPKLTAERAEALRSKFAAPPPVISEDIIR